MNAFDLAKGWALFQVWHNAGGIEPHFSMPESGIYWKYGNSPIYACHGTDPKAINFPWGYLSYGGGAAYCNHRSKEDRAGTWMRWQAAQHCLFLDGHVEPQTPGQIKYITGSAYNYQGCCCFWFY